MSPYDVALSDEVLILMPLSGGQQVGGGAGDVRPGWHDGSAGKLKLLAKGLISFEGYSTNGQSSELSFFPSI